MPDMSDAYINNSQLYWKSVSIIVSTN